VGEERGGRRAQLDEPAANLKRLERVAVDNSTYIEENLRIHALWSALCAVNNAIDVPVGHPFCDELCVLRHASTVRHDAIVSAALEAGNTADIGVEPLADLASWFTTSVALVPDEGPGVLALVASHVLLTVAFRRQCLAPGNDALSIFARAGCHLNEKDWIAQHELNQLKEAAKALFQNWLEAARRRLEVRRAPEVRYIFISDGMKMPATE